MISFNSNDDVLLFIVAVVLLEGGVGVGLWGVDSTLQGRRYEIVSGGTQVLFICHLKIKRNLVEMLYDVVIISLVVTLSGKVSPGKVPPENSPPENSPLEISPLGKVPPRGLGLGLELGLELGLGVVTLVTLTLVTLTLVTLTIVTLTLVALTPGGTFPRGTFPRGDISRGEFSGGDFPGGTFPRGNFPRTVVTCVLCSKHYTAFILLVLTLSML